MKTEEEEIKSLLEDIENDLFVKLEGDNSPETGQEDRDMTADNKDVNNGSRRSLFRCKKQCDRYFYLYVQGVQFVRTESKCIFKVEKFHNFNVKILISLLMWDILY